jgi:hypothetical protein
VPAGAPELNASVTLANNPNNPFTMFLIDPSGDAVAQGANLLTSASTFQSTSLLGAQVRALSPAPGAWTLIVAYIPQVAGTALSEPFTVSTSENAVPASAAGLPDSLATTLAAGKPQTVQVRVKNPSAAPAAYFVDGRLAGSTTLPLTALTDPTTTVPLSILNNLPEYVIPTNSTAMSATASTTGSTPIMFDSAGPAGDPDIGSTVGNSVVGSFRANPISQGLWDIAPDVVGAFGPAPVPNEPVTTSMSVTTQPFDPAVSASTGDMWLASVDPTVLGSLSPVIIGPGQTGTIPVTITPKGPAGATVSGTLYVDTEDLLVFANFLSPNGSQVAAIPYRYTIAK